MGRKLILEWLKEDQRLFLDRDYLQDGQTPEERYREIAETIEKYSLKMSTTTESVAYCKGIGDRFEEYISKGWVSFSTPVLINFGKKTNLPISCVDEDTWINTISGGKMAKHINKGDEVLTHKGRFRKVTDVIPTLNRGDIWKLKVVNRMTPLLLTGDHKVKTNLGWVRVDELDIEKHLIAGNNLVDFGISKDYTIDLKKYTNYSFTIIDSKICKSIERNVESNSIKNNKSESHVTYYSTPNEFVDVTEELAWAIGLWFADGSLSKNNKNQPNGIRLTQHLKEEDIVIKWLSIMKKSLNLNGDYYKSEVNSNYSKRGKANWISVNLNGKIIGEFFNSFGEGALKKELPDWILNLPKNKLQNFLDGVLSGDGHIKDKKNVLILSNPILLLQMYNIALKLGHDVSLQMQQKPSIHNKTKYVYNLTFRNYKISTSKFSASSGIKYEDGLVYFPIRELVKTDLVRNVYDFTVEEDHSFSCAGVVVHNCNKSILEDSLDDIYKGIHELGMLAKYGAGTSQNFSNLRPIGSNISTGGHSNSVMDWIELYSDMMSKTNQNRARRGFLTAYLSADHPEIMDFLDIGTHRIPTEKQRFFQTLTTGVTLPIGWRTELKNGDKEKRKIWAKILKTRKEIGFPYILDLENCNNSRPQVYKDKDMFIQTSNICCVTGDTLILTNNGYKPIIETIGLETTIWNGEEWSNVIPFKTSERTDIYEIVTGSGQTLKVSGNHNFYIKENYHGKVKKKITLDLKVGDKLIKFNLPIIQGDKNLLSPYSQGFFSGDGHIVHGRPFINLYGVKRDIIPHLDIRYKYLNRVGKKEQGTELSINEYENKTVVALNEHLVMDKNFVPDSSYTIESRLDWLAGILDSDGTSTTNIQGDRISRGLQIGSINLKFLKDMQLMLQTLGCNSKIKLLSDEGFKKLPKNDGSGEKKDYFCNTSYRLLITHCDTYRLVTLGLKCHRLDLSINKAQREASNFIKIKSVTMLDNKQSTYCFTESKRGMGMFNGILTGQCETSEFCDKDKTFACCLSSANAYYFDDWKDDTNFIFDMNIMLDCVIEEYIEKGSKLSGLEKAVRFAKEHRSIGLGILGFHSYLQKKKIVFGELASYGVNNKIFSKLKLESDGASKWMAIHFGEPLILKGYGERNTTRLAQAPTKSTSYIMGGLELNLSEGIELHKSNYTSKKLAKIQSEVKNKELVDLLELIGRNTKDVWDSILIHNGSVQHLEFLNEREKLLFRTFPEVSQADVIKLAAQRQKFIDQGQSLNIMIHPDTPPNEINKLHMLAFDEGVKGLYYQYSINAAQEFNKELLICSACEA